MRSLWKSRVREVVAADLKNAHRSDRMAENKLRFAAKNRMRDEGIESNLFPITPMVGPTAQRVYRYELVVSRKPSVATSTHQPPSKGGAISSSKGWRCFSNGLRRFADLPPMVRVDKCVYSVGPIAPNMLQLPQEFLDIGWESCSLVPIDSVDYSSMAPADLRSLVNRIFPWSIQLHANRDGSYTNARDHDGKMVCTHDGISVSGLRIYRGTVTSAVFVDTTGEEAGSGNHSGVPLGSSPARKPPPPTKALDTQPAGVVVTEPIPFRCVRYDRKVNFKEHIIHAFTVEDASGCIPFAAWNAPQDLLIPGKLYQITNGRIRASTKGRAVEYTHGTSVVVEIPEEENEINSASDRATTAACDASKIQLAMKIDTKCLVASERSLWDDIVQHFGSGPHDKEAQQKIARVVQGTPVVVSTSLRHGVIRTLRFGTVLTAPQLANLKMRDPTLHEMMSQLDPNQPLAVLNDYSVVPLQALHCSFDPRMRTWQDVAVAGCSFIPKRRVEVLDSFRTALEHGFSLWGLSLSKQPLVSRAISVLPPPMKENAYDVHNRGAQPQLAYTQQTPSANRPATIPSTLLVVSVVDDRCGAEEKEKCVGTAQSLAKAMNGHYINAATVQQASAAIEGALVVNGAPRDTNSGVILIVPERDTRATRWLTGECLRFGAVPVVMGGTPANRRHLLTGNIKLQFRAKNATNPTQGINIGKEVPAIANKRVLLIGVDSCDSSTGTIGAMVGVLTSPSGSTVTATFWKNHVRGQEVEQVAQHLSTVIAKHMHTHRIDEIILLQDGNVLSELGAMKSRVPLGCGLTFLCLHKRSNIRFLFRGRNTGDTITTNAAKGCIVHSNTPAPMLYKPVARSFYLQNHECPMSTARIVEYTVHAVSETLDLTDVQKLLFSTSHCYAPAATKLPLPVRCSHRLANIVSGIMDASPDFDVKEIPDSVLSKLWYL